MEKKILIVDDDIHMRSSVVEILRRRGGLEISSCSNGMEALQLFKEEKFDLVISDIKMPGMTGIDLLEKIRDINSDVPFIVMTAFGDVETAVKAMKMRAYDYIEKGASLLDELEIRVDRALEHKALINENSRLKKTLNQQFEYIGKASDMNDIRELINSVAPSRSTVLITGESGTGKELIARSIHYLSDRADGPFIKVNCAALPEGLIESELFGHEKGAFTGAMKTKAGKFELASGGTLLLDEIGEMPIGVQAKLLRVLQEKEVSKVGGDEPVNVDVRIVATTNRNLEEEIKNGEFREDLFYRINVFHIELPPLKERMEDVLLIAEHFIEKYNDENGFSVVGLSKEAEKSLLTYSWPGNIRELENSIERAVVLTKTGDINSSSLNLKQGAIKSGEGIVAGMTVSEAERELILKTLDHCDGNRTKAAAMLDISIRTLRNKLNEYNGDSEDNN